MSEVFFNPDDQEFRRGARAGRGGLVRLVINLSGGAIRTERGANRFLLLLALIIFVLAVIVFLRTS